ncbi:MULTISPECIES: DUF2635 domain-containing protein [unclassified Bradyrhizobium]|uniref:DUF2635 domain-containing protein n=1 Tax=unclassified Bradyrhizobium TaxID=2631580 RepID=UPI00291710CD|nr:MULTISPECIES: DUF2635 domain-containing protein [unclassified Bradyrhizobium]
MENIFLKPAPLAADGVVRVRDPQTGAPLAASGEWKARSQYWTRRLRDGDVIEVQQAEMEPTADTWAASGIDPKLSLARVAD